MDKKYKLNKMKDLKKYKKPKFSVIRVCMSDSFLAAGSGDFDDDADVFSAKAQTFRIFDDSFDDDLSIAEESDYATTTNTIEVW